VDGAIFIPAGSAYLHVTSPVPCPAQLLPASLLLKGLQSDLAAFASTSSVKGVRLQAVNVTCVTSVSAWIQGRDSSSICVGVFVQ
jgi:hypothetical protein